MIALACKVPGNILLIMLSFYLLGSQAIFCQSNEGTEFWFTFLEHRDRANKRVCMISSKYNANGLIELPSTGWSQNISIAANTVQIISIPAEAEMLSNETIDFTAVKVSMDKPSSVYIHQYHQMRSDASLVLPLPALGNQYYIMSYSPYQTGGELYPSEFALVGIEDNTQITIKASANTKAGLSIGNSIQIILNKAQTYQVHGATINDDLTGTYIAADKKIAVFSGNRWAQVPKGCGNRDNLFEQMYPTDSWGREFVMVPTKKTTNDIFRFISASDNNTIEIFNKGNILNQSFTLNSGQWIELRMDANARYVKASNAIMLAQFLVGGNCNGNNQFGDPAMVLLNSLEHYRDTVTLYNSPFEDITDNFINITIKARDSSSFLLDGRSLNSYNTIFQTIGPADEFAYAQIDVSDGPHTLIGGGCGVIAIAYGYGFAESYAYGGGANFTKINNLPLPDGACVNDTILFKSGLPIDRFKVEWDFGNGNKSNLHETIYQFTQTGTFPVKLKIINICLNTVDSIVKNLSITLRQDLTVTGDTAVCIGDTVYLFAQDKPEAKYIWTGPNAYSSFEKNPIITNVTNNHIGRYEVTSIINGCASYPNSVWVDVVTNPTPDLGRDTFYCSLQGFLQLDPGVFTSYKWQDGYRGFSYEIKSEGLYIVEVENETGCKGIDSVYIQEKCPVVLFVPNAFSPNGDQINDFFKAEIKFHTFFSLEIFDRWGDLLFKTSDPEEGWNGRFSKQPMLPGVYIYSILYSGYDTKGIHHKFKKAGDFTLIR